MGEGPDGAESGAAGQTTGSKIDTGWGRGVEVTVGITDRHRTHMSCYVEPEETGRLDAQLATGMGRMAVRR